MQRNVQGQEIKNSIKHAFNGFIWRKLTGKEPYFAIRFSGMAIALIAAGRIRTSRLVQGNAKTSMNQGSIEF
jgi:hypothetical protein